MALEFFLRAKRHQPLLHARPLACMLAALVTLTGEPGLKHPARGEGRK
jgi:hypothetical protein